MKKTIKFFESLPWGYGIAYKDYSMALAVCYPLGLNWLVRWARELYFLICAPKNDYWEKKESRMREEMRTDMEKRIDKEVERRLDMAIKLALNIIKE